MVIQLTVDTLSTTLAALADPTRRAILTRLASGPATVKEISAPFAMSGPAVSKHLRVLERAGLISRGREAQWRPCRLEPAPLKGVAEFAEDFRRFWDASFDRLDEHLQTLKGGTGCGASQMARSSECEASTRRSFPTNGS